MAIQKDMHANSHMFHEGVGGLNDRYTLSTNPFYYQLEKLRKNITRYIEQLKKEGGQPIEYFSDKEITHIVDPYFLSNLGFFDQEKLGMKKIYTPNSESGSRIDPFTLGINKSLENLEQVRPFVKQKNTKVVTQEQKVKKVILYIDKPIQKKAINERQKESDISNNIDVNSIIQELQLIAEKLFGNLTLARSSNDASENLTQARSFAKQENEKVVTQEQGISKVAVNINKPVKKEAINESQKKVIAERLEFVFAKIRKIEITSVALEAIELISKEIEFNEKEEAFLEQHDCLEEVSFIRKIFAHPYPQNREVGDSTIGMGPEGIKDGRVHFLSNGLLISTPPGLLSLTILGNSTALPITKKAVIGYVEHLIRKEKELLEKREKQASK